jgi:hypothetical protein
MPLTQGSSRKSIGKNIRTEKEAGRPTNQSIAIAMSVAAKAKQNKKKK